MTDLPMVYNNPPREYVDNHVDGTVIPSTKGEVAFDPIGDTYKQKDAIPKGNIYGKAEEEKAKITGAIEQFQTTVGKKLQISIDLSIHHPWEELDTVMKKVEEDYSKRSGSGRMAAAFRSFFHKMGENGECFSAFLGLLPSGEYTSIVCGAFQLVMKAAISFRNIREAIFDALGDIPASLAKAKIYFEMYKSLELHMECSKLYVAILGVFGHIITWMKEKSLWKATKAFGQQTGYERDLTLKIGTVAKCAREVREQASICSQYVLGSINQKMERQTMHIRGMRVTLEGTRESINQMEGSMDDIKLSQARVEDRLNAFYLLFSDSWRDFMATKALKEDIQESIPDKVTSKLSQRKLRHLLGHNPEIPERDVHKSLADGRAFNMRQQERAEYFMASSRFKAWLTTRHSEAMLVNGRADSDKVSPVSFAFGLLANSLKTFPATLAISFFCGLHTNRGNGNCGAQAMLASLICQLLEIHLTFDLSFLVKAQQPALEDHDVDTLCGVFTELIRQLPAGQVIFCLIDGISFYEYANQKGDTAKVITSIARLVEDDEKIQAVFKLLISSPSQSRQSGEILGRKDIYNLPETIEHKNQGFSGKGFKKRANKQIKELEHDVQDEAHPSSWGPSSSDEETESD